MARSGNTLLRLMLDSHPDLAIPPETDFIPEVAAACRQAGQAEDAFLRSVTGHWRFRDLQVDAYELERRVRGADDLDVGEGLRRLYALYAEKFGKSRWGDKTPYYLQHMPLIQELLPEARFVHIIRDGRDVALDVRDLWFGPDSVAEAAGWWRDGIAAARAAARQLEHYDELRFEDLVRDPEPTLRRICAFVELDWAPAMLDYHRRAPDRVREVITPLRGEHGEVIADVPARHGIHRFLSDPPRRDQIGLWRAQMTAAERRDFAAGAGELLRDLGYDRA
jgi:hypothetical protein